MCLPDGEVIERYKSFPESSKNVELTRRQVESVGVSANERIRWRRSGWARGEGSEEDKDKDKDKVGTPEIYEGSISSPFVRMTGNCTCRHTVGAPRVPVAKVGGFGLMVSPYRGAGIRRGRNKGATPTGCERRMSGRRVSARRVCVVILS
jgi:hypothetical protein